MSPRERNVAEVLTRTRRLWSPGADAATRVRRRLDARLAAGAGLALAGAAGVWPTRLLFAGAVAAAAGAGGFWAGYRAGQRVAPASPASVSASTSRAAAPGFAPPVATAPPAIQPVDHSPPLAAPAVTRRERRGARHGSDDVPSREGSTLAIELRALRNAERALRDGSPGLALAFLQDLDRQVPHGELAEEREATTTLARCARGDQPFDVNLGGEFATRHPTSVYRARVEQACARTDGGAAGDPPRRRSGP